MVNTTGAETGPSYALLKSTGEESGPPVPAESSRVWTVNVSGPERHDGEAPYTYVVCAESLELAVRHAWLVHVWIDYAEGGAITLHELPDVVVIDSPEFPCHPGPPLFPSVTDDVGRPTLCRARHHYVLGVDIQHCGCEFHWFWIGAGVGDTPPPAHAAPSEYTKAIAHQSDRRS
ncbi:hypothetical protein [Nocardia puris]|uniref:hypothetical protein n=1 Tax=Nocardia puris TaxID=208602 RepID=UPI0011BD6606|nr:hypothetical protein [Nocardia puris]